jgi:phosphoesterase RecJ-like protein
VRHDGRAPDELRPLSIEPGFVRSATGSALIEAGGTRVICTASAVEDLPRWLAGSGRGWVTAEYGMLPASTGERKQRDVSRGRPDGRTVEIQRLIGRSLRGVIDFQALGERTIYIDCDVLEADGGTRCAAISGGFVALKLALDRLRKDTEMYLYGDSALPREYAFMELDGLRRGAPPDPSGRILIALDCANASRLGPDLDLLERAPLTVNVDHHHDNTRFAALNLIVAGASSTGEILRDLFRELGVELTPEIAEALYIALVTDTGRFQYTNTTPRALRLAAELVEAGADVHRVFQGVYETVQFAKLKLLARALERAQVYEGGRLVVSYLLRKDFTEVGAAEAYSEGIIDYLRAVEGADMAALIREPPRSDGPARRVSLRASTDELDVSAIARKSGGGGHRQAAGFSSDASVEEITDFLHHELLANAPATRS